MDKLSSFDIGVITALEKVAISAPLSQLVAKMKYGTNMPANVHRRMVAARGTTPNLKRRAKELGQEIAAGATQTAYDKGSRVRGGDMANKTYSRVFKGGSPGLKKKK